MEKVKTEDTIAAIATPPGKGGVGIIRISGINAYSIAQKIIRKQLKSRYATISKFYAIDNSIIDVGIALFFQQPHSFTGEDVIEFHTHGSPVALDYLLQEIIQQQARLARPGEFSERAFLNGKIDLSQAEAIADLIESGSRQAAKAAVVSLQGKFSEKINELLQQLIYLRMYVEAAIDFPEEEIDFLSDNKINVEVTKGLQKLQEIKTAANQGQLLKDGMRVVITGKPNAGKSSLLNQLCGHDSAIVTDIPGTTRDVLREYIQLDGMPLHIIDTAGLHKSNDLVEKEGIKRSIQEIEKADHVLLIVDTSIKQEAENIFKDEFSTIIGNKPITLIQNKIDLINEMPEIQVNDSYATVKLSAKTGVGIDLLRQYLKQCMGYNVAFEGQFIARRRHLSALARAENHINTGYQQLQQHKAGELFAEDLRQAQLALSEITGEFTSDDLLGEIFGKFCIGK